MTPAIVDVSCAGGTDGSISVVATGGGGGHDFAWSNNQSGPVITNLAAGLYIVTTTDASNCSVIDTFQVIQPQPIVTNVGGKNVNCFGGSSGSATVGASGGAGGFQFLWDDPTGSNSASVGNLSAGIYHVTVTDMNGCSALDSVTISQPPPFNSIMNAGQISCFGIADGEGTVTPLGGTGPYSYLWNDPAGQTTMAASNLLSGTYLVTITDKNGCTTTDTLVLTDPPLLTSSVNPVNVTCFGANDGKAQAVALGGSQPYKFSWSNGTQQSLAQNLPPGTHTVTVTDARGCTSTSSAMIDQAPEMILSGTATSVKCTGDKDGTIDLNVGGGANPYAFIWNNGAVIEDPAGLGPGIYVVTVTDANNCQKTFNIQVTSPPGMSGDYESEDIACFGDSTGVASAIITGGSPGYGYLWSNGETTAEITGLLPGTYTVTVSDQNGCTLEHAIEIAQPLEPLVATMTADTLDCFGDGNGRVLFDVTGGTPTYKYSLDGTTFNGSNIQIGLKAGTYDGYVRDKLGCAFYVGQVTIHQPAEILVGLGEEIFIELGQDTQLITQVTNGVPPLTYQWSPQDSSFLSCLACPDPFVSGLHHAFVPGIGYRCEWLYRRGSDHSECRKSGSSLCPPHFHRIMTSIMTGWVSWVVRVPGSSVSRSSIGGVNKFSWRKISQSKKV
ncbi:MAG: SprB repeat-containing protein [Saprospiraceae bacterium]|nr:SprB repeat-containing protein [Saprospiraceae bacterium]